MVDRNAELGERVNRLLHASVSRRTELKIAGRASVLTVAGGLVLPIGSERVSAQSLEQGVDGVFNFYEMPALVDGGRVDGFVDQSPTFRTSPELPRHLGINFKEPGKIIYDRNLIPANELAHYDELVRISRGAGEYKNEENEILFTGDEATVQIWNGGLGLFTFEEGWLELLGTEGVTSQTQGNNQWLDFYQRIANDGTQRTSARWLVGIRGWHGDSDKPNLRIVSHMTVAGAAKFTRYSNRPAGGFISYEQLLQKADAAVGQQSQLEAIRYAAVDANTGAFAVAEQSVIGGRRVGGAVLIESNIR